VARSAPSLDPALPQLGIALDPARVAAHLEREVYRERVDVRDLAVVRHKAGRRCTVRYELDVGSAGARRDRVYGKFFASGRAPRVYASSRALATAKACSPAAEVPEPVGHSRELKLVLQREVPGTGARAALLAGDGALAERLADAVYALHTSAVLLDRSHSLRDEIRPLEERVDRLVADAPTLGPRAWKCLSLAHHGCELDWRWRRRPLHRDFYDEQALVHEAGLAVIDFDDAAMGEPAVDVANFLAHLRLVALERSESRPTLEDVAAAFRRRYGELDASLDGRLVAFLEGTTLLRLACIHLQRSGETLAAGLLEESERLLLTIRQWGSGW